jgi:membrane associated rhomboid family serine protease
MPKANWRSRNFFPITTICLVVVNLLAFLLEYKQGGVENLATLEFLGALNSHVFSRGQWWRAIAANFLHYGPSHLALNLFALSILGLITEKYYGALRFLGLFLGSGITSMALMGVWFNYTQQHHQLLVGSSAAILGLVGGLMVIYIQQWLDYPSIYYRNRLLGFTGIIILQFFLDSQIPQVSLLSHLLGLGTGILLGWILRSL